MLLDIAPSDFLLIAAVAIVAIGPKDMPRALRTAGRWMGKMRRVSNHLRSGLESMIREAELEEMEKKWRTQNDAVMAAHPQADFTQTAENMAGANMAGELPAPAAHQPPQPAAPELTQPPHNPQA